MLTVQIRRVSNYPIMESYLFIDESDNTIHSGSFSYEEVMYRRTLLPSFGIITAADLESAYYDTLCKYDDKARMILEKHLFKNILWRLPRY